MKTFEPILNDMPISFAEQNKDYFRNKAREKAFGSPVYFFPPNYTLEQYGCGGYHYEYGYPYELKRGYKGNCTYWCGCRYLQVSNILLKEVIGRAVDTYDKYTERKDGGNFNGQNIGATIQKGDMLVFADNLQKQGDGHIVFVEDVNGYIANISESAYSQKSVYEGKACITYTLDTRDLVCGRTITLRPQMPYNEILYGVIHTGDVFDKQEPSKDVSKNLKQINKLAKEIVDLSK